MKKTPTNTDTDRGQRISAKVREEMQSRIDTLISGRGQKLLKGDQRLHAAHFISKLYAQAKARHRPKWIEKHCDAVIKAGADFRIHRWMLRQSETEITPELTQHYKGKVEPARKVRLYLKLVAALAELLGKEPFDLQQEFVTVTGLNARPLPHDPMLDPAEVQPELRLAHLLRDHAAQMANRLDLARLFQRAERLQTGWSLHGGPVAKFLDSEFFRFDQKSPPTFVSWLDDAVPPYPSVKVARIPYGFLAGSFSVVPLTDDGTEPSQDRATRTLEGSATACWELYLAIAPTGNMGVGSYMIRTASVDIHLPMGDDGEMVTHTLLDADEGRPASLSAEVAEPWLLGRRGFTPTQTELAPNTAGVGEPQFSDLAFPAGFAMALDRQNITLPDLATQADVNEPGVRALQMGCAESLSVPELIRLSKRLSVDPQVFIQKITEHVVASPNDGSKY